MADNEYRRRQERNSSTGENLLKLGTVVGAGALAYRYRGQIRNVARIGGDLAGGVTAQSISRLSRSSRLSDTAHRLSAYGRALNRTAIGRSPLHHLANQKTFSRRLEDNLRRELSEKPIGQASSFQSPTEIEKSFYELRNSIKQGHRRVVQNLRYNRIMSDLQQKMPEYMDKGLKEILAQEDDRFFNKPSDKKLRGLLERYSGDKAKEEGYAHNLEFIDSDKKKKEFVSDMLDTLDKYKDTESFRRSEIEDAQKKFSETLYDTFKETYQKRDTFFTRMMEKQGFRQLTVKDALELELFEDDAIRRPAARGRHIDAKLGKILGRMAKEDRDLLRLSVDKNIYVDSKGEIVDLRGMSNAVYSAVAGVRDNTQIPFLRFNPLDLMHFTTFDAIRDAPGTYFLKRGTIDTMLGASRNIKTNSHPMEHNRDAAVGPLAQDYVYSGGKVFDINDMSVVKDNVYLASARFGMMPRAVAAMGNLHSKSYEARTGILGKTKDILDLGNQETESMISRMKSTFTKFDDERWSPNIQALLRAGRLDPEVAYKELYSDMQMNTTMLSDDAVEAVNSRVKEAYGDLDIDLTKLETQEEIMGALGRISERARKPGTDIALNDGLMKQMDQALRSYQSNSEEYGKTIRIVTDHLPQMPEPMAVVDLHEANPVDKIQDAKRLIHQHALRQVQYKEGVTVGSLMRDSLNKGEIGEDALSEVRNLETLTTMRKWWDDIYLGSPENKEEALKEFTEEATDPTKNFTLSLKQSIDEMNPIYSMGPGQAPPQYFGYVGYMTMNKARGWTSMQEDINNRLAAGENVLKAGAKGVLGILGQPFAGRKNLDQVTTASMIGYYAAERLDNAVAQIGLGLSQKNRGSMQSILGNQFLRRIALPYAAYQQAVWLDGMTGDFFSDQAAETYVTMHEDVGHVKEFLGINKILGSWQQVFAGGDQIAELTPVKAFNFATFGLFSDDRSGEEIREYYESGEDPIRKGRYWGIGSNTPWSGGKIMRYEPNWYRKLKSDYKFTDTMYGSEWEYWNNHWMPTLTAPWAPIKHFLTDTNHWEEKHSETRPYPITGGIPELEMIPLIGPALNNTVGQVLKPRVEHPDLEKAHRKYLEEMNQMMREKQEQLTGGGYIQFMPAGGYDVLSTSGSTAGSGIGVSGGGTHTGNGYGISDGESIGQATGEARARLLAINMGIREAGGPALGAGGSPVRSITSLQDLRDPNLVTDLQDVGEMHSLSGSFRDTFYSITEMAGIYGFSLKTFTGWEESGRGMTLEPSSRMMSYQRAWWDLELGGLGGEMSEIGRRYLPRDPNKNYYNPLPNQMPEWLPGIDYFVDFQHGDPYVKVPKGEMRLPGEAYETLHELHPDAFGKYGAFDRYKILADVAPYSKEYKFYKRVVSQMNQEGLLTEEMNEEYAEIRDQVSNKKDKYRFYNKRFHNADIQYEEVTITDIIDQNTFLTEEYGNNPIKLAGVYIKSDDEQAKAFASQFIYEGATVKVGLDADPLFRVRDDMMNTMRAVVYTGNRSQGLPFFMSDQGQNLNYMLANRSFGGFMGIGGENNVSIKDDGSATATAALFSDTQITVGKIWESAVHDVLPNLPIIGTITDKFLQVRTPLEMYKRSQVYGKDWRPWQEPIQGWIVPMVQQMQENNPLVAAAQGGGIGWLASRGPAGKYWGKWIGAAIGAGLATQRVFKEQLGLDNNEGSDTWIPERRQTEREINQYFDKLKYIKYRALYKKAAEKAEKLEGVNIDRLLSEHENRGEENKAERKALNAAKKYLSMSKKMGYGDEEAVELKLDEIRKTLREIDADRPGMKIGKHTMLALQYRAEYESTLYGADPHGDMRNIFRALPSKDREFFTEFMKAAPEDREEILRLVPKDQRRFYQAKWGLEMDEKVKLSSYFKKHFLPDESWEGWEANTSLDAIKIKVIKNEGLELTEFGYWSDDVQQAKQSGTERIPMKSMTDNLDVGRLESVLRGAGLSDVSVTINSVDNQDDNKIDLAMDIIKDRSQELVRELNNNWSSIFG